MHQGQLHALTEVSIKHRPGKREGTTPPSESVSDLGGSAGKLKRSHLPAQDLRTSGPPPTKGFLNFPVCKPLIRILSWS